MNQTFSLVQKKRYTYLSIVLYILIYGGYIKMLFPNISIVVFPLQAMAALIGILQFLQRGISLPCAKGMKWIVIIAGVIDVQMLIMSIFSPYQYAETIVFNIIKTIVYMIAIICVTSVIKHYGLLAKFIDMVSQVNICLFFIALLFDVRIIIQTLSSGLRFETENQNAIWLCRFACDMILLLIFSAPKGKVKKRIWLVCIFAVYAFITGSKGPLITTIALVIFFGLIRYQTKYPIKKVIILCCIGVVFLGVIDLLWSSTNQFIQQRYSLDVILANQHGYRLHRYVFSIKEIMNKPLFGFGSGSWGIRYGEAIGNYPHNYLLEVWYEFGIIPIIAMIIIYIMIFVKFIKEHNSEPEFSILFILFSSNIGYAMTSGAVFDGNPGIYYFFAMLAVA